MNQTQDSLQMNIAPADPIHGLVCPLCAEAAYEIVDSLRGSDIEKLWSTLLGRNIELARCSSVQPDSIVALRRCARCHFEYFDPTLAGSDSFYSAISHGDYYCPTRPEFARTISLLRERRPKRILDIGCGDGTFLDLARGLGCDTYGIELNLRAAERAKERGHRVFHKPVEELQLIECGGTFDVVTLFQVLEHVAHPVQVLKNALHLLSPGGLLAVAVPSAEGAHRLCPWDPHHWPPHHLSHWRRADLHHVARSLNLSLVEAGGDPLYGRPFGGLIKLHGQMSQVLGRDRWFTPKSDFVCSLIGFLFRAFGLRNFFSQAGASVYAYFEKPI